MGKRTDKNGTREKGWLFTRQHKSRDRLFVKGEMLPACPPSWPPYHLLPDGCYFVRLLWYVCVLIRTVIAFQPVFAWLDSLHACMHGHLCIFPFSTTLVCIVYVICSAFCDFSAIHQRKKNQNYYYVVRERVEIVNGQVLYSNEQTMCQCCIYFRKWIAKQETS